MQITPLNGIIGSAAPRIDGPEKVTGTARYGADQPVAGAAWAYLVTAPVARGRITAIDDAAAHALPGVLGILTHANGGAEVKSGKWFKKGGHMTTAVQPLGSDRIHYAGQIVAIVAADTFEAARDAAARVRVEVTAEPVAASFGDAGLGEGKPDALGDTDLKSGDFDRFYDAFPRHVDHWYETPPNHHNPLELFQTICAWEEGRLTVWESTQNVRGCQHGLAEQLGISAAKIRVVSPYVGGAFGSRGELGHHTALVAYLARRIGRPLKLVASRQQGFTLRTFRAETRHRVRLAADRGCRLQALAHDAWELTSRTEPFGLAGSDQTARLYACANIRTSVRNLQADRQTPGFMRAPPETPYLFALESAMDELAYELGADPLDLRRRNDSQVDPIRGVPYTSRSLLECIDAGAEAFGWNARDRAPGSMRDGDWLVGFGCASAFYPTQMGPADARVTLRADGIATVEVGTHEIGTGIRTVLAQTVADLLGLDLAAVAVRIGDSTLPAAPLSAGSNSTATVCSVVAKACEGLRTRLAAGAVADRRGTLHGADKTAVALRERVLVAGNRFEPLETAIRRVGRGRPLVETATNNPHGAPPILGPAMIRRGKLFITGGSALKDRLQFAFGAQFVEVRVNRFTGEIRCPRIVGAFAAGRIMNRRTATAQLTGGQLWGLSSALHEVTEIDRRHARYMNDDLAEYHIPVNADVDEVRALIVEEEDRLVNPLGIKGVGELGTTGMNAAVANAVFHATGVRVRKLPIRIEDVLESAFLAL